MTLIVCPIIYDPTEGRILLDGQDNNLGILFQDYIRYQMTYYQNIAVGNIKKIENEKLVRRAAEESLADQLALKFPSAYQQWLGRKFNDGVELSGGNWQKVALAIAYMRRRPSFNIG